MEHNEHLKELRMARDFAIGKHGNQKYGNKPYSFHLDMVYQWVITKDNYDRKHLHICAFLHDVLEDTDTTCQEIEDLFGSAVARIVKLVTKNPDESYYVYIERLKKDNDARFLKACDVGVNLFYLHENDLGFIRMNVHTMIQLADF